MAASLFNLSDLNRAIIESSFIDTEKLRSRMNPRGRKPVSRAGNAKPLYSRDFVDLLLPAAFIRQPLWYYAYIEHEGSTALNKLMNGATDGLSSHRKIMEVLAHRGFTVSASDELQLLSALSDCCRRFLEEYAPDGADPSETLEHWKTETGVSASIPDSCSPLQVQYLDALSSLSRDPAHHAEAFAGMLLLGLISGFAGESGAPAPIETDMVFEDWLNGFLAWIRSGFPRYAVSSYRIENETARLRTHYESTRNDFLAAVDPLILPELKDLSDAAAGIDHRPDPAALLQLQEEIIFFTGRAGTGKKSLLKYLFAHDTDKSAATIPLYLPVIPKDGLLKAVVRLLRLPSSLDSWDSVPAFTGSSRLRIYLPDLLLHDKPDLCVRMVTEALEKMPEGTLQFMISSLVCPFDLNRFTRRVFACQPLSDETKAAYLARYLPASAALRCKSDTVMWKLLDSPLNLSHFCAAAIRTGRVPDDRADSGSSLAYTLDDVPQTVSDILGSYVAGLLHPGEDDSLYNAAFLYLLPALAAYMDYLGVQTIGHRRAMKVFLDADLFPILHTDVIAKYRYAFTEKDMAYCWQVLTGTGVLLSRGSTYSFSFPMLQSYASALHSFNIFDIEIKENLFVSSSYPYDSHTDYFWQMLSTDLMHRYERLLPDITFDDSRYDVARLFVSWSVLIFYGNGRDEKGCIDISLPPAERRRHLIDTLERAADMLEPLMPAGAFPCPAWNYAYYVKREAEELLLTDPVKYADKAKDLFYRSFMVIKRMVSRIESDRDMPDRDFGCKHIFDKYAQFLIQRCHPLSQDDDGLWHMPGDPAAYTDADLDREILRVLKVAADHGNAISKYRLGLLLMHRPDPDYSGAYRLFLESAALGDFFARGMVGELLLDHSEALAREQLPVASAPVGFARRPRTPEEAAKRGLTADCVIAYIRSQFDAAVYQSVISDSRKTPYATAFHQLGRCYMQKGDRENALRFLRTAADIDWSQNDNEGEYDRLLQDLQDAETMPQ